MFVVRSRLGVVVDMRLIAMGMMVHINVLVVLATSATMSHVEGKALSAPLIRPMHVDMIMPPAVHGCLHAATRSTAIRLCAMVSAWVTPTQTRALAQAIMIV